MAKEINIDKVKQYTETINGVAYTAQFYGCRVALEAEKVYTDERTGRVDKIKLYDYLFENVIVSPSGLSIDSFDDLDELDEVAAFAIKVLRNRFRPKNESGDKGRSKK